MFSPKHTIACLVVFLLGSSGLVVGAPKTYPAAACRPGLDGPCTPKRVTYGYTPTSWRRWPTDPAAETPKAESENLPTPAKEPTPSEESEGPTLVPEEPAQAPAESEPVTPKTDALPPFEPPFEDMPPAPPKESPPPKEEKPKEDKMPQPLPKELPPPTEETMPDAPPELPTDTQSPLDTEAPPTPPEDDPFKDDPFKDEPPAGDTKRGASRNRLRSAQSQPTAIPWRSTSKKQAAVAQESQARPVSLNEPRRLQVNASEADGQGAAQPLVVPTRINPLRPAEGQVRAADVIPTASWSAPETSTSGETPPMRRNPLRAN